ncbi:MAG: GDP-mannose 4,6-dehydratase [Xanthomonadales bacterium]|nr:GDP-mannose 4,6-dehydratase [Xanthomonadales bacterium]
MKRVLVTGATGFTGRYLVPELANAGCEVWETGRAAQPDNHRFRQADISRRDEVDALLNEIQPQAIVHLAAQAFVAAGDVESFYLTNLLGSRNLLSAAAEVLPSPPFLLLASSANVYGDAGDVLIRESQPANPANEYAVSKLAMEYLARLWMDRLPMVIVRPFNYTGAGQGGQFLLPKIVEHLRSGATCIELGNLEVRRDVSDVRAVVEAYRRLLEHQPAGETVQICSGESYTLRDMLGMAEVIAGRKLEVSVDERLVRGNEIRCLRGSPDHLCELIGDWQSPPLHDTLSWMLDA